MKKRDVQRSTDQKRKVRAEFYLDLELDEYLNSHPTMGRAEIVREAIKLYMKKFPLEKLIPEATEGK